jgi:hypothetical protein
MVKDIDGFTFQDQIQHDEGFVFIRVTDTYVGIALSLKQDGDIEVFMDKEKSLQLVEILQKAINSLH